MKNEEMIHWTKDKETDYHKKQFLEPKRSTVAFEKFVSKNTHISGRVLDIACGGGAVATYFAKLHPDMTIKGIDFVDKSALFEKYAPLDLKERVQLEVGDWYNLDKKYINAFDGVINTQTLSWLEDWKTPLERIIELNPQWIGISSLFYEGRIEFKIKVVDYERDDGIIDHDETFYNVYSIPIIKDFLNKNGYSVFSYEPFEIDVDIPKPDNLDMGTYTIKTENGKRLQISGGLLMPWFFLYAAKE